MLKLWIEENKLEKQDYPNKMEFYEFQEKIEITPEIKKDIAKRVLLSLKNPRYLKLKFNNRTSEEIEKYVHSILPNKNAKFYPQKSTWGEIISAEILNVFREHLIPIYKLRYKERKDKAMRGQADVVTYYFDANELIIAFTEVKTKGSMKTKGFYEYKNAMKKAENGLSENNVKEPEILEYMCERLFDEKKYDLLQKFDDAFNNPENYEKEFHIFMIMEKNKWQEQIIEFFKEDITQLPNLTINIVLINSLNNIIDETYEIIPKIAEDIINDFEK